MRVFDGWWINKEDLGSLHRHCLLCFSLTKCKKDGDWCPFMECNDGCGAQFHSCKESEHKELCSNQEVPCLNAEFGCDRTFLRKERVKHLVHCPANILPCTQEWNRWPVVCKERFKSVPFRQKNPVCFRGQLDLELALRDQRMVADLAKIPRRTKLALRNNLTRRYPTLPLPPHAAQKPPSIQDRNIRSLKDVISFEVSDDSIVGPQYGVAKLFLKNQEIQRRRWEEDVNQAIQRTGQPVPKRYWEYPELEKGNIHKHCSVCFTRECDKQPDYEKGEDSYVGQSCAMLLCSSGCGSQFHSCKAFEHRMICPLFEEEGEFDWILRESRRKVKKKSSEEKVKPIPDLLDLPPGIEEITTKSRRGIPPAPPPPKDLHRNVRFDLRFESFARVQKKPRAMYTFQCGQDLRRDQWEQHWKNVHSIIMGGLDNWLEARCPLSSLGCGFAFRRLYPGTKHGWNVVFSQDTNSFGIKPPEPQVKKGKSFNMEELPIEILHQILLMLDSWSLNQMSLVSRGMRWAVSNMLDSRGCVALQWEKKEKDGVTVNKNSWSVEYKRWFFSSHFDTVDHWGVNCDGAISEHLKVCPFNKRVEHKPVDKKNKMHKELIQEMSDYHRSFQLKTGGGLRRNKEYTNGHM